jgi:ribosomal protein S14
MNQTCDRCGHAVRAAYRIHREGDLYLCRHCTSQLRTALSGQGWAIWPLGEHALVPQAG